MQRFHWRYHLMSYGKLENLFTILVSHNNCVKRRNFTRLVMGIVYEENNYDLKLFLRESNIAVCVQVKVKYKI